MKALQPTLSGKLSAMTGLLFCALLAVVLLASHGMRLQRDRLAEQSQLADAARFHQEADMLHDAMRSDVLSALLGAEIGGAAAQDAVDTLRRDSMAFAEKLAALDGRDLPEALQASVAASREAATAYARQAERTAQLAVSRRPDALAQLPQFDAHFENARQALAHQTELLAQHRHAAQASAHAAEEQARQVLMLTGVGTLAFGLTLMIAIGRSIRRSIAQVSDVAQAVADGDLARRHDDTGPDEVGQLARAVNRMADTLRSMIDRMREEARRSAFGHELVEAFEMADAEAEAHAVVRRAMAEVSPEHPMELLLADSSRAHLESAAMHPGAGSPGCGVRSPFSCVAVRRGNTVVFSDSEALSACTQLRGRPCGPVSAVCVPVTFMGRALGVLHATGTVAEPLSAEQTHRLSTLGLHTGARIGTVRAFERTQTQASTDALTGLANRRSLEQRMRDLSAGSEAFAFVLCDLDHFKKLNDTHGHQAGDEALRRFAEVLRKSMRETDQAARWGGEEFAFVLAGSSAQDAMAWADRVRGRLADTLASGAGPGFTASFGIADSTLSRQLDSLVQAADAALYASKHAGRDRASIADAQTLATSNRRQATERLAGVDVQQIATQA